MTRPYTLMTLRRTSGGVLFGSARVERMNFTSAMPFILFDAIGRTVTVAAFGLGAGVSSAAGAGGIDWAKNENVSIITSP
jgi:hypothetical protein